MIRFSACGGRVQEASGNLYGPTIPPFNESSFVCEWKLRAPDTMLDRHNRTGTTLTVSIFGFIGNGANTERSCSQRSKYIQVSGEYVDNKLQLLYFFQLYSAF